MRMYCVRRLKFVHCVRSSSDTSDFLGRRYMPESKMAAKLPEVVITLLVSQIHMSFQKQYRDL